MIFKNLFDQCKKEGSIQRVTFMGGAGVLPSDCGEDLYEEVVFMAKELAKIDIEVVNGGGPGVMRASTEGAKSVGGRVTAVTLRFKDDFEHKFEGIDKMNKFDKEIKTNNYFDRTRKLLELGDAHIIVKGGTGTFSEFAMAWEVAYLHSGHHKPLILYGDHWEVLFKAVDETFSLRKDEYSVYKIFDNPKKVVSYVKRINKKEKTWL